MGLLPFRKRQMCDCSDPALADAYEDVRSDASETDWLVAGYEGNSVKLTGSGSGGIEELASNLVDDQCQYAYLRVISGDEESKRAKFVFLSWGPGGASRLKVAKMSVHKASVKEVVRQFAIEIHCTEREELDAEAIMKEVRLAGGANYGAGNE